MRFLAWIGRWVHDLFNPLGHEPVVLPAPRPLGEVLLRQAVWTEVIGHNAPLIDKAAHIAHPHIVFGTAQWAAARAAREVGDARARAIGTDGDWT